VHFPLFLIIVTREWITAELIALYVIIRLIEILRFRRQYNTFIALLVIIRLIEFLRSERQ